MDDQVTLLAYVDQVRELIRHNRNDEAIAICRHILQYYPKYIDAYRQMGEAYLEKHDYESAKSLFRRVLSADPENVIAYVGMATIFDEEHAINEAVWHMERAFELAPGNAELQNELMRLYGELDAKPRARAKLTSGALGRIYAQSGLFSHAIQEFRTLIANSPARYDIRVALAETLWRIGHISEASQVAQSILEQLPFCLKANLILGAAWKESGLADSDLYLQRAQLLDPLNQTAMRLWGAHAPLAPVQATVPRYIEGTTPPAPLVAPGTEFPNLAPAQTPTDLATSTETPAPTIEAGDLPDWLRDAQPQAEPATQEELPPWLQPPAEETPAPTESPDWLTQLDQAKTETAAPTPAIEETPATTETPAWLSQIGEAKAEQVETPAIEETPATTETPDWLVQSTETPAIEEQPATTETPAEQIETPRAELAAPTETPGVTEQPPAWVQYLQTSHEEETAAPSVEPTAGATPTSEQSTWLEDLQATEPAMLEAMDAESETQATSLTEAEAWFNEQATAPSAQMQEPTPEEIEEQRRFPPQEELPPWLQGFEELGYQRPASATFEPATTESTEAVPDWLAELDREKPASAEETPAPEEPSKELPAWLEQPTAPMPAPATAEPIPAWLAETTPPPEPPAPIEATAPVSAETFTPAPAPKRKRQPKYSTRLAQARAYRDAGNLDDALKEYDFVVQHAPRLVPHVIDDLEVLIQRLDVPLEAHRILGDAYSRADRLADALERYRFVLEHVSST